MPIKIVGNIRLSWVHSILSTLDWPMHNWCQEITSHQHAQIRNVETIHNQTINSCLEECPQWKNIRKKYNIQGNIQMLLGRDCEVERLWSFWRRCLMKYKYTDEISMTSAAPYSHKWLWCKVNSLVTNHH